jgi:hypothetical protein
MANPVMKKIKIKRVAKKTVLTKQQMIEWEVGKAKPWLNKQKMLGESVCSVQYEEKMKGACSIKNVS